MFWKCVQAFPFVLLQFVVNLEFLLHNNVIVVLNVFKITYLLCFAAGNINTFMTEALSNVSTLLVNEETNTLFVGGRDVVFALDLNNISREIARVN